MQYEDLRISSGAPWELKLFSLIPGILIIAQGASMLLYPLSDSQVKEIERDLDTR